MKLSSPLYIKLRKKFTLNLNQYRNSHYRTLNSLKIKYKEVMKEQILSIVKHKIYRCCIFYTVYKNDKRHFDIGNICSVHQKFCEDALVELGRLEDDRYVNIPMCVFSVGGIDNDNPRVEIEIIEFKKKDCVKQIIKKVEEIIERSMSLWKKK